MKISNPGRPAELVRIKIKMLLQDAGVETYMVAFKDPDTDVVCSATKGDLLWSIGALEARRVDLLREFLRVRAIG